MIKTKETTRTEFPAATVSTTLFLVVCGCLTIAQKVDAGQLRATVVNPTDRSCYDEPVRLDVALPPSATSQEYRVESGGREVVGQVALYDGTKRIWVLASLEPKESVEYVVRPETPQTNFNGATVHRDGDKFLVTNDHLAVHVPATAATYVRSPLLDVRLPDGRWVGNGHWHSQRELKSFQAEVLDQGPIFVRVRLRYEFHGTAGLKGKVQSFSQVDVTVVHGMRHVLVEEAHEMDRGDYWEFDCAAGWNARKAICIPHGRMPAHGGPKIELPSSLRIGQTRMGDILLHLQPRWTQSYDEGWLFACHNGRMALGAVPVQAGRWHWPHNNLISVCVKTDGDYAGLRMPTWKGRRVWFLVAGNQAEWQEEQAKAYVTRHAFQSLNKLQHDYILQWPGLERLLPKDKKSEVKLGSFRGFDFYSSWMNPSSGVRAFGRRLMRDDAGLGNLTDLTQAQVFLDPDSHGSYWNFWSPENPNFFTDYNRCGILLTARLTKHPQFHHLAAMAEQKLREDMYHSITLPGGAGQECPGYVAYAMQNWKSLAEVCRKRLGFDPTLWPRYRAGASFLLHLSQPIGKGRRRCHPGGDTHPPGPDVFQIASEMGVHEEVRDFTSEELPGFGCAFRNRPGTERESYLAFKSGPNRGHYHGDQLSFHYCADARPVVIDHMCSYSPRAGQEHMHNRVAFHTDELPWANMDGFERLVAFETSPDVDVAIGQVKSERLRATTKFPPEVWDTYLPEHRFQQPLTYRRTIVCLKNQGSDYFVIRDQHVGPPVQATYCLHVLSNRVQQEAGRFDFGNVQVACVKPTAYAYSRHDWQFEKKERKNGAGYGEKTIGIRLTAADEEKEFITVLYPGKQAPPIERTESGVRIGSDEISFAGGVDDIDETVYVAVRREGRLAMNVTGREIDLDRSQGDIGLFVPDAGYPFGEIPDWLIRQRAQVPDWAPDWARHARRYELQ